MAQMGSDLGSYNGYKLPSERLLQCAASAIFDSRILDEDLRKIIRIVFHRAGDLRRKILTGDFGFRGLSAGRGHAIHANSGVPHKKTMDYPSGSEDEDTIAHSKTAQAIPVVRGLGPEESTTLGRRRPRSVSRLSTITASQPESVFMDLQLATICLAVPTKWPGPAHTIMRRAVFLTLRSTSWVRWKNQRGIGFPDGTGVEHADLPVLSHWTSDIDEGIPCLVKRRGRVLAASWNDESTQETEFNGLFRPRPIIIVADDGGTVGSEVVEPKRGDYAQSSKVISYVIPKIAGKTLLVKEEDRLQVQSQTEPEKLPA
ncbi:hypothetical protein B0H13DRAFT_2282925 [Mycena leptocephala]|nr:hypothetical protein B0H13DRAFT_2282925 [Mycena leptocephala]